MKKKIEVVICAGTHCYLMGGSELQLFNDYIPSEIAQRINLRGSPCLDLCNKQGEGKPPFAMVNGRVIRQATLKSLLEEVNNEIKKGEE